MFSFAGGTSGREVNVAETGIFGRSKVFEKEKTRIAQSAPGVQTSTEVTVYNFRVLEPLMLLMQHKVPFQTSF